MLVVGCNLVEALLYKVENLLPPPLVAGTAYKYWRQLLPILQELFFIVVQLFGKQVGAHFVCLCVDYGKGHTGIAKVYEKLHIYILNLVSGVYKYKEQSQLLRAGYVAIVHLGDTLLLCHREFCVSVAGQVYKVELVIYSEIVYKYCLARFGRGLGKPLMVAEHIDKGRFAYVGPSYKGKLRQSPCRLIL